MENASNEKPAQIPGASEGRKSTPYQRIVIACPENHIIVVKRFSNGEVKVEGGRLVAVEDKKGR
ncbi:unnamed protein product [Pocillopora meandrina]|uniref:Uncharacterized protein n=1 Tax=Pocillopora meandrina TaxID=46732 RepID=A0AAU9XGR5_9CNID|nr:unnamed protein product [Pocillopora meandrina]